jgi:hypothetical protein
MEEGNPRLVYYLLETFNNVILFQMNENPNLIYGILRNRSRFEGLGSFTLKAGVREIKKLKEARSKNRDKKEEENMSDKKRGKMKEVIPEDESKEEEKEDEDEEPVEAFEGRNGFIATEEWVSSWREG